MLRYSGMQATVYPNAYGSNCNSGSSQPYSLPDFGSLSKDPLLPQRCQDPTVMQVSSLPGKAKPTQLPQTSQLLAVRCIVRLARSYNQDMYRDGLHLDRSAR